MKECLCPSAPKRGVSTLTVHTGQGRPETRGQVLVLKASYIGQATTTTTTTSSSRILEAAAVVGGWDCTALLGTTTLLISSWAGLAPRVGWARLGWRHTSIGYSGTCDVRKWSPEFEHGLLSA